MVTTCCHHLFTGKTVAVLPVRKEQIEGFCRYGGNLGGGYNARYGNAVISHAKVANMSYSDTLREARCFLYLKIHYSTSYASKFMVSFSSILSFLKDTEVAS